MRVLLTGGTGFLGGRVADMLHEAGHQAVLLARRPQELDAERFEVIAGDLLAPETISKAAEGCEAVLHLAALVKRWMRDRSMFDRVNVQGLDEVIDRSLAAGARKIVYCSSFIALGPTDDQIGHEEQAHDGRPRNDYERTKLAADRRARERQAAGDPLVVVYPGVVYGPGRLTDGNIMATVASDLIRGKLPGTIGPGDRRQCLAYVDDVARGVLLALDKAEFGTRYMLGGENVTVRQALGIIADEAGVSVPKRKIPYGLAAGLGKMLRWQAGLTRIEPMLTDEEVQIYRHEWAYSSQRAIRELGYSITPSNEGLRRMVRWLIDEQGVRPRAKG